VARRREIPWGGPLRQLRPVARRIAPVTAAVIAVGGLSAATAAIAAETPTPVLRLAAATPSQTLLRTEDGYLNDAIGVYTVAGPTPFEIRTKRDPKGPKVTAQLRAADGTFTALPDGVVKDVNMLDDFFRYEVKDSKGKVVIKRHSAFCPNAYQPQRAHPDAPATNPYPDRCGFMPYAYGQILGIQAGWSVPIFDYGDGGLSALKDGTYRLKVYINSHYRKALKISVPSASATVKITLKTVKEARGSFPGRAATASARQHAHHMTPGMDMSDTRFGVNESPRPLGVRQQAAAKPPTALLRPSAIDPNGPLPDLRSLPAFAIGLEAVGKKTNLTFAANVWNAGPSPLVVDGFRRPGKDFMDAYQYVFDAEGNQVGSMSAGTMAWDPRKGHEHWHFKDFASYRLLDATRTKAIVSGKESFCLLPTDPIDTTLPGANLRPSSTDLSTACGGKSALSIRETLDAGHGDTYYQSLPGQSFDVTNVPNGTYYVEVMANPMKRLAERSTTNNVSIRKVIIGGTPGGKRTVRVPVIWGIKGM
jgi:hypothetical protein